MRKEIVALREKKANAQKYISIMRPLFSHLLVKAGVVNAAGAVDKPALEALKQEAGIKSRPNMARALEKRVIGKRR
jgi:hypothetical protein